MRAVGLLFALAFASGASARPPDELRHLEEDPSPAATQALSSLYKRTKNRDQRFWLIRALGVRLKSLGDQGALRVLLAAAADEDPGLRGPALRGLAGFGSIPGEVVDRDWIGRLEAAASRAGRDPAPGVRGGAEDLRRALRDWRHTRARPLPPRQSVPADEAVPGPGGIVALGLGWVWLLGAPLVVAGWGLLGLPVRPPKLGVPGILRSVPWAVVLGILVFAFFWPVELVWRALARRAPPARPSRIIWILETGSIRAAYLVLGIIACEGYGLGPALEKASALLPAGGRNRVKAEFSVGAFDSRFALLCAAPALAFFCMLTARRQAVEWHVSVPIRIAGCSLWAWGVLAGLLYAVTQTLEGIRAAGDVNSALGREGFR